MTALDVDHWNARKKTIRLSSGRQLAYVERPAEGPVVLLIHGFSDSSRSFALLESFLPGLSLLMPDLIGHGGSDCPEQGYGLEAMATDLRLLLAERGTTPDVIAGHSLGAMVALKLAAGLKSPAKGLVLISGSLRPGLDADARLSAWIGNLADPIDPDCSFLEGWYEAGGMVPDAFLRQMRREAASIHAHVWRNVFAALENGDLTDEARSLTLPVLTIAGSEDRLFDQRHRQAIHESIPAGRHITMEGIGHNPHWDAPQEVAAHIASFMANDPQDSA